MYELSGIISHVRDADDFPDEEEGGGGGGGGAQRGAAEGHLVASIRVRGGEGEGKERVGERGEKCPTFAAR